MKLLAFSSSPRINGNTNLLLDALLRGVREVWEPELKTAENSIDVIRLATMNIRPCIHCDYCQKHGGCSISDDMQSLYPKLAEADWLVLASPIYFMAHCAQAKLFIDRCQVFWSRKPGVRTWRSASGGRFWTAARRMRPGCRQSGHRSRTSPGWPASITSCRHKAGGRTRRMSQQPMI